VKCPKCKKLEWTKRNIVITAIFAIFFSWLFISILPDTPQPSAPSVPVASEPLSDRLKLGLSAANTFTSYATATSTIEDLNAEVLIFDIWAKYIAEGKNSSSTEEVAMAKELEKKVILIQTKEFPKIRKEATRFFRDTLWEGDIEVRVNGSKNETLSLIGAFFAANKNIKTAYESLDPALIKYRFQKVQFAWYEGGDWTVFDVTKDAQYLKDDAIKK